MSQAETSTALVYQGFSDPAQDRMPLMPLDAMTPAQRAAAEALIAGPRKAVFGPFIPLLRSPDLLGRVGKVGEYLRFESGLDVRVRELVTCLAARHVSNQFEWLMHAPLALKAGVQRAALDDIAHGRHPRALAADESVAIDFASELLHHHGVSDASYAAAKTAFGEQGVIDLATLVGYFVMVCWVMNATRTPVKNQTDFAALDAFPL
jgi:4-carboxymuconolactone decarboxylase